MYSPYLKGFPQHRRRQSARPPARLPRRTGARPGVGPLYTCPPTTGPAPLAQRPPRPTAPGSAAAPGRDGRTNPRERRRRPARGRRLRRGMGAACPGTVGPGHGRTDGQDSNKVRTERGQSRTSSQGRASITQRDQAAEGRGLEHRQYVSLSTPIARTSVNSHTLHFGRALGMTPRRALACEQYRRPWGGPASALSQTWGARR